MLKIDFRENRIESVTKEIKGDIMNVKGAANMSLEYQRYGRNKKTAINHTYINSGEYRNKFNHITDNDDVNRIIYSKAKEMLKHRSGTELEDMYWIDMATGKVIAGALDEKERGTVQYSRKINSAISDNGNLLTMHTHPNSMPPSIADFNSAYLHKYKMALVICHDGKIFKYVAKEPVSEKLYTMYIERYVGEGYSEYDAQYKTLEKLSRDYAIYFEEVL